MADDDYKVQTYQDDLADDNTPDPFAEEETDDPAEGFGIPSAEFKSELDKLVDDEDEDLDGDNVDIDDDQREFVESLDTDDPDDRGY